MWKAKPNPGQFLLFKNPTSDAYFTSQKEDA